MSPYRRNILVGATVLVALTALGWMILKFGDRPVRMFSTPTMPITFVGDRADGLGEGSNITYDGVIVGRVKNVKRQEDGKGVVISAELDIRPPLPQNVHGEVVMMSALGGTSTMVLSVDGPQPEGVLTGGVQLRSRFLGLQFLPPEFAELARELKMTTIQFRESKLILHLDEQVQKAGQVLDAANTLIADPKVREDIKTATANIRTASETINRIGTKLDKLTDDAQTTMSDVRTTVKTTGANVETLSKQASERLEQISKTLDHFQSIAAKIDNGQGTAGQMVNDPKLYQALVDSTKELNMTITDFKRLVEQWEQEGVSFKLK
jgi:phospholipid/cholesterol/gamma-HCH transport system substrate-binding protein